MLAVGLTLFAVYLPIAAGLHRDVVLDRPNGLQVELLEGFEPSADGGYQVRVYGSALHKKGILYEGTAPLGEVAIVGQQQLPRTPRLIRMTPKDASDPRTNGRRYYLVQP